VSLSVVAACDRCGRKAQVGALIKAKGGMIRVETTSPVTERFVTYEIHDAWSTGGFDFTEQGRHYCPDCKCRKGASPGGGG
jgi:hypothetical protein